MWFDPMEATGDVKERVPVTARIPEHILKEIDASPEREDVPVSHNHWIIETLAKKLRRVDIED